VVVFYLATQYDTMEAKLLGFRGGLNYCMIGRCILLVATHIGFLVEDWMF